MKNKKSGVYCVENIINGKMYIGQSVDLRRRKRNHFSKLGQNKHPNKHLQNSYNKYGKTNFKFSVLVYCEPFELTKYEQFFVNLYSPEKLYNVCLACVTTTKNVPLSEEHKKKISESLSGEKHPFYGKTFSKEYREKISKNHADVSGEKNPFFGKKHSEEARRKMSEAQSGKTLSKKHKAKLSKYFSGKNNPMYGVRLRGKDNGFYGKKHSKETLEKLSGENGSNTKLKEKQVFKILDLYYNKKQKAFEIAKNFPVGEGAIYAIINGKTWKKFHNQFMKNNKEKYGNKS